MEALAVAAISLIRQPDQSLESFGDEVLAQLRDLPPPTRFVVLPEYCWGHEFTPGVLEVIENIASKIEINAHVVFGSAIYVSNGTKYNAAILRQVDGTISYFPKTRTLEGEIHRSEVTPGHNPGIIEIDGLRIAIIVCADLWDGKLLHQLCSIEKADLLLVPAFTVVPPSHGPYAKTQWQSLSITRSREYVIPIVVADHDRSYGEYDVGNATMIVDPSLKSPDIQSIDDFLSLPTRNVALSTLNLDAIHGYRDYRYQNGLLVD